MVLCSPSRCTFSWTVVSDIMGLVDEIRSVFNGWFRTAVGANVLGLDRPHDIQGGREVTARYLLVRLAIQLSDHTHVDDALSEGYAMFDEAVALAGNSTAECGKLVLVALDEICGLLNLANPLEPLSELLVEHGERDDDAFDAGAIIASAYVGRPAGATRLAPEIYASCDEAVLAAGTWAVVADLYSMLVFLLATNTAARKAALSLRV